MVNQNLIQLFEENCYCPICLKISKDAVESICCGNIFCNECFPSLQECPICRCSELKVRPTLIIRKLIKKFPFSCIYDCGFIDFQDKIEQHYQKCEKRYYHCKINDCNKNFIRSDFIKHLSLEHQELILNLAENYSLIVDKKHEKSFSYERQLNHRTNLVVKESGINVLTITKVCDKDSEEEI